MGDIRRKGRRGKPGRVSVRPSEGDALIKGGGAPVTHVLLTRQLSRVTLQSAGAGYWMIM